MWSKRLRPAYSDDELRGIYPAPHDHRTMALSNDHELRVSTTIEMIQEIKYLDSAADLSCGNGILLDAVECKTKYYGDFAPGWEFCGPIEETINWIPRVSLFLLCETLEHVDDPYFLLCKIRAKTGAMVLSTPIGEDSDANPEHYFGWDEEYIEWLLGRAGWRVREHRSTRPEAGYRFQIWVVK